MPSNPDATCLSCGTVNPLGSRACRVCGAPLEASVFLASGSRVGSYELEGVLGRGGFGITYRARDTGSGEIVALKELFPEGLATRGDNNAVRIPNSSLTEWKQLKTRFSYEAQLLQRIKHEASTHFKALFEANDTLYLAMEFVQGETLEARLQSGKRLGMKEARSLLKDVLGVLEEVHAANLLHRDITPANIILQPGGAELIDFGSGIYFEKNRTMNISQRLLTPAYAPLELYGSNVRLSPAADLYSLAATVYEAVSGLRPPSALERANGAKLKSLSALRPDISASFASAIDAALSVRVDARPQSVAAFRALLEQKTPKAQPIKQAPRVRGPARVPIHPRGGAVTGTAPGDSAIFGRAVTTLTVVFVVAFIAMIGFGVSEFWARLMFAAGSGGMAGAVVFCGAWSVVQLVRLTIGIVFNFDSMGFYRQSMLGVYCVGSVLLFRRLFGNWLGFWEEMPTALIVGGLGSIFGLMFSSAPAKPRVLGSWQSLGLHIAIPCLIFGWFFNPLYLFGSSSTAWLPLSLRGWLAPPATTTVSPVSSPAGQPRAFADVAITGNKWVCQQHLGKPFVETMFKGTFLIPLDDESHAVAKALELRLNAKALLCSDVANNIQKFTNLDVSLRKDRAKAGTIIWQFVPLLETQLAMVGRWLSTKADIVLLTAKPIDGTVEFLERVSYKGRQNFILVSTAALKPSDYQGAGRTTLLERVAAVIKQQRAKKPAEVNSLEELDALWNPQVKVALPVAVTPQELLKRLPSAKSVLRLERAFDGGIQVAALSANGRFAVTGFPSGEVRVWDTISGKRLSRVFIPGGIAELSIDSAGQFVAVATQKRGVVVFNLETKALVGGVDTGSVTEVLFSPDRRYLLLARVTGYTFKLEVLSVAALRQGTRTPVLSLEPRIGAIRASAFNADSSYLTLGGKGGQLQVYALKKLLGQAKRGERIQGALPLKSHVKAVSDIAFSTDGRWMASADEDDLVRLWDVKANFKLVRKPGFGVAVAFSPDSQQLLFSSLGFYRSVNVLNLERLQKDASRLDGVSNPIFALGFNATRQAIGVSSAGIHVLDAQRQLETRTLFSAPSQPSQLELDARDNVLWMAHYNSEDLGRLDLNTRQYRVRRLKNPLDGSLLEPEYLSLGQDGQLFVFAGDGSGGAELLDVQGGAVKRFANNYWDYQDDILVSPNGQWAVGQGGARRFDLRSSKVKTVELTVPEWAYYPNLTIFAPDSRSLYSFNTDESFTQWNLQTAKPIRRFGNADGIPRRAASSHLRVSRDGRFFVTARKNGRVTLWNARSGQRLTEWRELEDVSYNECCYNAIYDVQVSSDGRYVVASTSQGAVIFDTTEKRAAARFDLNGTTVSAFTFHPNKNRLYVATTDGVIRQFAWR